MRRFDSSQEFGFDLTYWPENQRFRSASLPVYHVEDQYQNPGDDDKFDLVVTHLEEAREGAPEDLYVADTPAGRVGIIVMDYFEDPRQLVPNVIRTNFATAATGAHRERADGR